MVDINKFIGKTALRKSIVRKRNVVLKKIAKVNVKLLPLQAEFKMYDDMLAIADNASTMQIKGLPIKEISQENETAEKSDLQDFISNTHP